MANENTLLIRKHTRAGDSGNVLSTLARWNIACVSFPFVTSGSIKEPYTNKWKDEQGEEPYIPDVLRQDGYDVTAEFAYKGHLNTAYSTLTAFKQFLDGRDGNGADLDIYHPQTGIGRQHCYLKDFGDEGFVRSNIDDVLTFSVTFRVSDPVTAVYLSYST